MGSRLKDNEGQPGVQGKRSPNTMNNGSKGNIRDLLEERSKGGGKSATLGGGGLRRFGFEGGRGKIHLAHDFTAQKKGGRSRTFSGNPKNPGVPKPRLYGGLKRETGGESVSPTSVKVGIPTRKNWD